MSMPLGLDGPRMREIAASNRPLAPHECAERARLAAALIEPGRLDSTGQGEAGLLWRDEQSEAWVKLWWQPPENRDHDHNRPGGRGRGGRGPRGDRPLDHAA